MKKFSAAFILFYWGNYIKEDWSTLNSMGKFCLYVPWILRSVVMWALCPLAIPEFLIKRSKTYQDFVFKLPKV